MVSGIPPTAQEKVMQEARQLGIHESVVFTGFVPDALLVRFYQAARVLVVPSLYEGYGLPIVEALACETPVLAARAPGAAELVDPDSTFDPYNVEDLATALHQSLVDDDAIERLRGWRPVRQTWDETAKRTVSAYEGLAQPFSHAMS
jgi:glycosyltransferase involved in cell wall biosynthesis